MPLPGNTHARTRACTVVRSTAAGHTQVLEIHSTRYKDGGGGEHGPFRTDRHFLGSSLSSQLDLKLARLGLFSS